MKNNKLFLVVTAFVVALVSAALVYFTQQKEQAKIDADPRIPQSELIDTHNHVQGPEDAKVTIVEFFDPECESCREMFLVVKQLLKEYEGKLRVVSRYMPFHGNALFAASVIEEAKEQGKYDEAIYALFEKQPEWGSHHAPKPELIPGYMQKLGIDPGTLDRETVIAKHRAKVEKDYAVGLKLGVNKTPTFFVNGKMLHSIGYEVLRDAIEAELKANNANADAMSTTR